MTRPRSSLFPSGPFLVPRAVLLPAVLPMVLAAWLVAAPARAQEASADVRTSEAGPVVDGPEVTEAVDRDASDDRDDRDDRDGPLSWLPFPLPFGEAFEPAAEAPEPLAPGPLTLDLQRTVDLALGRNPSLLAEVERLSEVEGGVAEAWADALPQLTLVASWGQSRNPTFLNSPDFADIVEQFPGGDFEPSIQELWRLSTEFSQALYTFGKVGAAVELARLAEDVTRSQIEARRLDVALEAVEAYYEVLGSREALEVVSFQERARRGNLEVVEARYEIGEATRLELLRARSALADVGPLLAERRGALETARSRLRQSLALPADLELTVEAVERPLPVAPAFGELAEEARNRRPELADLALQRRSLGLQQEVVTAEGRPQIDLTGRYGREVRFLDNLEDPLYADWAVTIGLRWEFFDGGRRRGEIARLESQARQLAWRLQALEDDVLLEVRTALIDYRTALERWRAAEVAAAEAREAARVARETYGEGVALQVDLLDAQEREVQAGLVRVQALFDARAEAARLSRAVGLVADETPWSTGAVEEPELPELLREPPEPPPLPEGIELPPRSETPPGTPSPPSSSDASSSEASSSEASSSESSPTVSPRARDLP